MKQCGAANEEKQRKKKTIFIFHDDFPRGGSLTAAVAADASIFPHQPVSSYQMFCLRYAIVCVCEWVIFLPLFHTNTHVHPGGMVVGKKFPLFLTLGVTRGRTMSAKCWTGSIFFVMGFAIKTI